MNAMKLMILTLLTAFAAGCRSPGRGGQTASPRLDPAFAQAIATNQATFVQGGTIVDAGLFAGPVPAAAVAGGPPGEAEMLLMFNFGADHAPDSPQLTEDERTVKNGLADLAKLAGKNPQMAAVAAGIQAASEALRAPAALPLGDRTGGQGVIRFRGASEDAKAVGVSALENFALIRGAAVTAGRADASGVSRTTHVEENTDAFVGQVVSGLVAYAQIQALDEREEQHADAGAPEKPSKPSVDAPVVGAGQSGDNNFLWKPVADNGGKLVVLLPAALGRASSVTANGKELTYSSTANGNRAHYRGSQVGAAYGSPVNVLAVFPSGNKSWVVPNGGKRTTIPYRGPAIAPPADADPVTPPATNAPPAGAWFDADPQTLLLTPEINARVTRVQVVHTRNGWEPAFPVSGHPGVGEENGFQWINLGKEDSGLYTAAKPIAEYPAGKRGSPVWLVTGNAGEKGKFPFYKDGNFVITADGEYQPEK